LYNLANVLGVQPATLQMSVSEVPCARAQEDVTLQLMLAVNSYSTC